MICESSASSYAETIESPIEAIEQRGLTVFARIDHAVGAREAGLALGDEQVVLFGNPKSGTALMQSDRRIGIELPLRILVWREGKPVNVGHNDPGDLSTKYDVAEHRSILEQTTALLEGLAGEATR